jgi:glutathione S-transferase
MYTLYIANKNYSSWSLRPWALMRSLSIPFEERLVNFEEGSNLNRFRAFSPNGRVPCLHDEKQVIWDSLAIVEYLAERHPGVWPDSPDTRAWVRCVVCEMHSGFSELRNRCPMNCALRVQLHEIGAPLQADLARIDEIWTEGQARFGGPYLAGAAFTAADAFFAPVVFRAQTFGLFPGGPARTYWEFMLQQPAMQEWYTDALSEPWRETSHEQQVATIGTVIADHRKAPVGAIDLP